MGFLQRVADTIGLQTGLRAGEPLPLSFDQWLSFFRYDGNAYPLMFQQTMSTARQELSDGTFGSVTSTAYRGNSVVFAVEMVRLLVFSEARFQWRAYSSKGRPGELYGTQALYPLEHPWPSGTTGDLLMQMLLDADLAGNWWGSLRPNGYIKRMRPDWVTCIWGSPNDPDVDAYDLDSVELGILYHPGGRYSGRRPVALLPGQYSHFAPTPDPTSHMHLGMSWLTPLYREIGADSAATAHKLRFFENGATPNMVVKLDQSIAFEQYQQWVAEFRQAEPTGAKAYKTLYLGGGADVTVVGSDLKQLDFKVTQGAGETRIAAAGGVPPVIVGLSEGLQGSSLNAGNYAMARRRLGDATMRPLWRNAAGSLAAIVDAPGGADLWYDDRGISFLKEDLKDAAEIQSQEAGTIRTLIDAGFEADSVVEAVVASDWDRLVHSGLFPVQLQPPGGNEPPPSEDGDAPPPPNQE